MNTIKVSHGVTVFSHHFQLIVIVHGSLLMQLWPFTGTALGSPVQWGVTMDFLNYHTIFIHKYAYSKFTLHFL